MKFEKILINKQTNKQTDRQRIEWLDLAKGIGILCVVFGHTHIPYLAGYLIYPFHVPLFFVLSGFCFRRKENENFGNFLLKKIKTLLVPYAFFSLIWIVYESVVSVINDGFNLNYLINEIFLYAKQDHLHAIWFITCIFLVELLAYFIVFVCKDKNNLLLILACLFILFTYFYKRFIDVGLIWNAEIVLPAMPFFLLGYVVKKQKVLFEKLTNWKLIPVYLALYVTIGFFNIKITGQSVDMYSNSYGNILLFYLAALLGTFFVVLLSKAINKISFINYIGKNSLIIFSLHQIVMKICRDCISNIELNNFQFVISEFLIFIISILITICFNEIVKKTPLVWFINGCKKKRKMVIVES